MTRSPSAALLMQLSTAPTLPALAQVALRVAVAVTKWDQARRTRMGLRDLDDHILSDIGITREEARREASKPFWYY